MTWRLANALISLRQDVNQRWPNRDKASDGTIGDAAHATRESDHNPWLIVGGIGVVRALDITANGIDPGWYAEQLRLAGAAGDSRLTGGGYVIYNRRITRADFSGWSVYTGSNPHTKHVHTSVSRNASGFDRTDRWPFLGGAGPAPVPVAGGAPAFPLPAGYYFGPRTGPRESISCMARDGSDHHWVPDLKRFQQRMIDRGWPMPKWGADGMYGETVAVSEIGQICVQFQREKGLAADGLIGPNTWGAAWTAPIT